MKKLTCRGGRRHPLRGLLVVEKKECGGRDVGCWSGRGLERDVLWRGGLVWAGVVSRRQPCAELCSSAPTPGALSSNKKVREDMAGRQYSEGVVIHE